MNKKVECKIEELSNSYIKILGSKEYFETFKNKNIAELKAYRMEINNELNMIQKIHTQIELELKSSKLAKLIKILSELLEIKNSLGGDIR